MRSTAEDGPGAANYALDDVGNGLLTEYLSIAVEPKNRNVIIDERLHGSYHLGCDFVDRLFPHQLWSILSSFVSLLHLGFIQVLPLHEEYEL